MKLSRPSHDLIINLPCRRVLYKLCPTPYLHPHLPWKVFLEKSPPTIYRGETIWPSSNGKSCEGMSSLNIWKEVDWNLLAYWIWPKEFYDRIGQWVEALHKNWDVVSQKPLRALHWNLTSSWNYFYLQVYMAIKSQWLKTLGNTPKISCWTAKEQVKKTMKRGNSDVKRFQL